MSWMLVIPVIAIGLSLMSIFIEFIMHDRDKGKELEFAIKRKQREIKGLQKSNDTKAMMQANKELMSLMGQNFKLRMKTMFISFPLFIVLFFFLNGALNVVPLYAGEVSQVGADLRNLDSSSQIVTAELVSADIGTSGANAREYELDDKGDQGDRQQVWWNVTASQGSKSYAIKVSAGESSDEESYNVKFVSPGSLLADFTPAEAGKVLGDSVEITPLYKGFEINVLGMNLSWFWYYFISYFIIAIAMTPLKNRILWGHWGGIKHLEKMEREKNEAAKK